MENWSGFGQSFCNYFNKMFGGYVETKYLCTAEFYIIIMKTKKEYERPRMEVIIMQRQTVLQSASGQAGTQDYYVNHYYEE